MPDQKISVGRDESEVLPTAFINGRFLSQPLTGVQRYALEITKAIDELISDDATLQHVQWKLLIPPNQIHELPRLKWIRPKVVGRPAVGYLWEQLVLPFAAAGGVLVNLGNTAPLLHPRNVVVVHDASVFRTPANFSVTYVIAHRSILKLLSYTATIGTVSEFSQLELADVLRIKKSAIFIARNGVDHIRGIVPDFGILERLELSPSGYFVILGTRSRNKNVPFAIEAFQEARIAGAKLVIAGAGSAKVFGVESGASGEGIVLAGRVTDSELVGLLQKCAALVFPSLYEGFGIPPMEAMLHGCRVLASDIPVVREICGDAAEYFDPTDASQLTGSLISTFEAAKVRSSTDGAQQRIRAERFRWSDGASAILKAIERLRPQAPS